MVRCKKCVFFHRDSSWCKKRNIHVAKGRKRHCESFRENPLKAESNPIETIKGFWQYKILKGDVKKQESLLRRGLVKSAEDNVLTEDDLKPVLSEE